MRVKVVILAAGQGKRFGSPLPKVLAEVRGQPIVARVVNAVLQAQVTDRPVVVVGVGADAVKQALGAGCDYVLQEPQLGTGHAVAQCRSLLERKADVVLVLYGDHPLISASTIRELVEEHQQFDPIITMATVTVPDFAEWRQPFTNFGRIVRDPLGNVQRIVEVKDADDAELKIHEVNPAYFCINAHWLWENVGKIKNDNVQGEYYLTDLAAFAIRQGQVVRTVPVAAPEALGVNDIHQLDLIVRLIDA